MIEHSFELFVFTVLFMFVIIAFVYAHIAKRDMDSANAGRRAEAIDKAIEQAVMAIEEEARMSLPGQKPTSAQKRELAAGFALRMLSEYKIAIPLDIVVGKIDAAVYRLNNHEQGERALPLSAEPLR